MELKDLLLPYQLEFCRRLKSKSYWISSRQIGKSFTIGYLSAYTALFKKNSLVLLISTGSRAAQELLKKVALFAEAVRLMSGNAITYSQSADKIEFSNGGRVISLPSGNPSALRGYTSDLTCIDEACFIEHPEEVLAAISPTLTRNPNSKLVMTSTPAGRNSLFFKLIQDAGDDTYVQETTIHDAIAAGLDIDLEKLRSLCPDEDIFRQEYECCWLDSASSMLDVGILDWYDDQVKSNEAYLGVDVGSTSDRSAFVTIRNKGGVVFVDDAVVMKNASYEHQLEVLRDLHSKNSYSSGLIDSTGIGSAFAEFARNCTVVVHIQLFHAVRHRAGVIRRVLAECRGQRSICHDEPAQVAVVAGRCADLAAPGRRIQRNIFFAV